MCCALITFASCVIYLIPTCTHMHSTGSWTLLVEGHFSNLESDGPLGEAWGLDPHPTSADIVATCGDDATVRVWSIGAGRLLRKAQLDACCRYMRRWGEGGKSKI